MCFCIPESFFDQVNITLRSLNAALRLLLEAMKHINGSLKTNRIDGSISVSAMIANKLQDAAANAFQNFGRWRMLSGLGEEKLKSEFFLHL